MSNISIIWYINKLSIGVGVRFMEKLKITDIMEVDVLQKFQDSFAKAVGVASIIVDNNGDPVTKPSNFTDFCMKYTRGCNEGLKRCMRCDKEGGEESARTGKPSVYFCHAGLMDFAAPIMINGVQVGAVIGGQVLPSGPDKNKIIKIAEEIRIDPDKYIEALDKVKIVSEENIRASAELLFVVANTLSDMGYQKYNLLSSSEVINNFSQKIGKNINLLGNTLQDLSLKSEDLFTITKELSEETKNTKTNVDETDNILGFIKNVANQTKFLGLNASIESARAGEVGKGFGVVAQEISKLALLSADSSKKIAGILKNIKVGTELVEDKSSDLNLIAKSNKEFISAVKETLKDIEDMTIELTEVSIKMNNGK